MMGPHNSAHIMEGSALAARGYSNSNYDNRQRKGRPWCDHCNKPGHVKENCWKIHGKPADWKPSKSINDKDRRANNVYSDNNRDKNTILPTETSPFSKEQLEILQQLFSQNSLSQPSMSASGSGSGLLAQKGSGYGEEDWQC
ncbi:uncharacterized protein [Populus alba]|nr:uncharacterized protein LOC118058481 isoform X2 [Populus alba]